MAAPTFVASYSTSFIASTTPKTVSVTVGAGEYLVIVGATADSSSTLGTPTGGTGLTYTLKTSGTVSQYGPVYIWTTTSASTQTFTMSVSMTGSANDWGYCAYRFSGVSAIGVASNTTLSSGAPSLALTTGQANSAIVGITTDWNAVDGSTRTWRTINSITPTAGNGLERVYANPTGQYTVYSAYWGDAGAAGSVTLGLSAPSGQKYQIAGIEVRGVAGGTDAAVTASTVSATTAIPAPTTSASANASPSSISGTTSFPAPTPGLSYNVSPSTLAATTTISAPTPHADATVTTPATVAAVTTLPAPAIAVGGSANVSGTTIQATTTLPAPTTSAAVKVAPATVACTTTVPAPTPSAAITLSPSTVSATTIIPSTTEGAGVTASPGTVAGSTFVGTPTVSAGGSVGTAPNTVNATTSFPAPTVSAGTSVNVAASTISLSTSIPAPVVGVSVGPAPATISCLVSIPLPVIHTGVQVAPATISTLVTLPAPFVFLGAPTRSVFRFGAPRGLWYFDYVATTWVLRKPTALWKFTEVLMKMSVLSLQRVVVPVNVVPIRDITTDTVELAFPVQGVAPVTGDWKTGSWVTINSVPNASCTVGPSGIVTLVVGTYDIWVRITEALEKPVQKVGVLQIV